MAPDPAAIENTMPVANLQSYRSIALRAHTNAFASQGHAMMLESLVISVVGTGLGLLIAVAGVRTIGALASSRIPLLAGLEIDGRIIGFAFGLAIVVAVLCAAVPAWRNAADSAACILWIVCAPTPLPSSWR